jgi:orotate phosphoribosyltransferase
MPRHPELVSFLLDRAIKFGSFKLASGQESDYYCDGKLVSFDGEGLSLIADAILHEIRDLPVDAIGGMDMGGTPIVAGVALRSRDLGTPIPAFVVRKSAKSHGTMKDIEGPLPDHGCRVAVVDDVVTSGGSIKDAIEKIRKAGHEVVLAISVLDRASGGAEAMAKLGVPYQPLATIAEIRQANERLGSRAH